MSSTCETNTQSRAKALRLTTEAPGALKSLEENATVPRVLAEYLLRREY